VEIPGTPAGRYKRPWHAPEVIPTTIKEELDKEMRFVPKPNRISQNQKIDAIGLLG
jgi:hypothetical protein